MPDRNDTKGALWLVQGPDVVSGRLHRALAGRGIREVQRIAADILVLEMTADSAVRLRTEFPDLIVEANSGLEPLR